MLKDNDKHCTDLRDYCMLISCHLFTNARGDFYKFRDSGKLIMTEPSTFRIRTKLLCTSISFSISLSVQKSQVNFTFSQDKK